MRQDDALHPELTVSEACVASVAWTGTAEIAVQVISFVRVSAVTLHADDAV